MGLFGRKKSSLTGADLRLEHLIKRIEKFAPRKYRSERELYYYNYKILNQYMEPLIALLERVSEYKRLRDEEAVLSREIFLRLKDFYDLKDRLSLEEALNDSNLYRRYMDLFMFFYGRKGPDISELRTWLLPSSQGL